MLTELLTKLAHTLRLPESWYSLFILLCNAVIAVVAVWLCFIAVRAWLRHAEVAKSMVEDNCDCANEGESMKVLTEENVIAQLQHLRTHPSVASRMANGHLFIHGWVYNIETSEIKAYDADQGRFLPLDGSHPIPVATPKARF